jgi:hypothetical protein
MAESLAPPWLPKDPGSARCVVEAESARLFDDAVSISLTARDGALQPDAFENRFTGTTLPLKGEFFTVTLRVDKSKRLASQFRLEGTLSCRPLAATAAAARAAFAGGCCCATAATTCARTSSSSRQRVPISPRFR